MKFSAMSYFIGKIKIFGSNFQIFKEKIAQFLFEYGPNNNSWLLLTKFTKFVAKIKKLLNTFLSRTISNHLPCDSRGRTRAFSVERHSRIHYSAR